MKWRVAGSNVEKTVRLEAALQYQCYKDCNVAG